MSDANKYMCRHDGCEKVYSQKTNRKRHEKTCSQKKEELPIEKFNVFYCSKSWCSKSFKAKFNCNRYETACSIFGSVATNYYNKKGELVTYKCCAQVDKKATIDQLNTMLKDAAKAYLSHQYFIASENAFWPRFKSGCRYPNRHFDFSENINLKPKHEAQSAHFFGRQHTCIAVYYMIKT